jgi:hypothetical protein
VALLAAVGLLTNDFFFIAMVLLLFFVIFLAYLTGRHFRRNRWRSLAKRALVVSGVLELATSGSAGLGWALEYRALSDWAGLGRTLQCGALSDWAGLGRTLQRGALSFRMIGRWSGCHEGLLGRRPVLNQRFLLDRHGITPVF